ncbi:hypothetical protein, conserved [Eimeria necatrix]|uniref:Uncharacterized protein n=1 Tax=Eimeria necatrix TaxID=51315 RepID=U6N4X5_9EIME|nr:hypothetical protein, conserved [Eimeria necatrix]CDJ68990.1 hypothetical protein, conserved [Eimeria necatrix]
MALAKMPQEQDLQVIQDNTANDEENAGRRSVKEEEFDDAPTRLPHSGTPRGPKSKPGLYVILVTLLVAGLIACRTVSRSAARHVASRAENDGIPGARVEERHLRENARSQFKESYSEQRRSLSKEKQTGGDAKAEEEGVHVPGEIEDLRKSRIPEVAIMEGKLEKSRKLLSAADRLAFLVTKPQAKELIGDAHEHVEQARLQFTNSGDIIASEEQLLLAVQDVRKLYLAAIAQCDALVNKVDMSEFFPMAGLETEGDETPLKAGKLNPEDTVQSMMITFYEIKDVYFEMIEQFQGVGRAPLNSKPFENEEDIDVLTDISDDLLFLWNAVASQQNLVWLANEFRNRIFTGLKEHMLSVSKTLLAFSESRLKHAQITIKLARKAHKPKGYASKTYELKFAEKKLAEAENGLNALRERIKELEATTKWEDMSEDTKVVLLQEAEQAKKLMLGLHKPVSEVPSIPHDLKLQSEELILDEAEGVHNACLAESHAVRELLKDAKARLEAWLEGAYSEGMDDTIQLSEDVYSELLSKIKQIREQAKQEVTAAAQSLLQAKEALGAAGAADPLKTQTERLVNLISIREKARQLALESERLELSELEFASLQRVATDAKIYRFRDSSAAKEHIITDTKEYEEAKRAVVQSETVVEMQAAMNRLRRSVAAMTRNIANDRMRKES